MRYAFAEQSTLIGLLKHFIKAQHNVGELAQKVTFKNDNIENYPRLHSMKLNPSKRKLENMFQTTKKQIPQIVLTDFDLPPRYSFDKKRIIASSAKVANNLITSVPNSTSVYPDKHWVENIGYEISEIAIGNTGSNYTLPPIVTIEGGGGSGATAKAYPNAGKISKIEVTNPGMGYLKAPDVVLNGSVEEGGVAGEARAVLGNGKV